MARIRTADADDAAAIAGLIEQLSYPASEAAVADRIRRLSDDPNITLLVAEDAGHVVGVATLHILAVLHEDAPRGQLTALVVAESSRGRGIGRALVRHVEDVAARHGVGRLVVTTANHRTAAHEFYARLGYEWTGRRYGKQLRSESR